MAKRTTSFISSNLVLFVILTLSLCFSPSILYSQVYGTDSHIVTVSVMPVSVLQINVGTINLNITGANAIAGQDQMTITDQSSTILWGTNSSTQKITVNTSLGSPLFEMRVFAVNPSVGTAAPEVILSTIDQDFILNIGRSSGSTSLRYTGVALASQGTGTDSHTITFTIQAQ